MLAAPRTDPSEPYYRTGLPPWVMTQSRTSGRMRRAAREFSYSFSAAVGHQHLSLERVQTKKFVVTCLGPTQSHRDMDGARRCSMKALRAGLCNQYEFAGLHACHLIVINHIRLDNNQHSSLKNHIRQWFMASGRRSDDRLQIAATETVHKIVVECKARDPESLSCRFRVS